MLHLIQIINHMLYTLEYTEDEIRSMLDEAKEGSLPLEILLDSVNLDASEEQLKRLYAALPRWESALFVVQQRGMVENEKI